MPSAFSPHAPTSALTRRTALSALGAAAVGLVAARPALAALPTSSSLPVASPAQLSTVVAFASTWVGVTPYLWGGTDLTRGADCSGFTLRVYEKVGIRLPRTAAQQRAAVRSVAPAAARPGDLVFFHDGALTTASNVSHVAVYVGDGQIVDASARRGVVVRRDIWSTAVTYGSLASALGRTERRSRRGVLTPAG